MSLRNIGLKPLALVTVVGLLSGTVALAETAVIYNGIDMWQTKGDGASFVDFSNEPIPAGFFCPGSRPFRGRVVWQGEPLNTRPTDALGNVDTIVHRLDDAAFDETGVAATRLQVRALSLVSVEPIRTSCGLFEVRASLHGEQPVTEMRIVRERETSGRFTSTLALKVRLSFVPIGKSKARRTPVSLVRSVEFVPTHPILWSDHSEETSRILRYKGFFLVDTDGDAEPDTFLPGTSNFFPGADAALVRELGLVTPKVLCTCGSTSPMCNCHYDKSTSCHCAEVP